MCPFVKIHFGFICRLDETVGCFCVFKSALNSFNSEKSSYNHNEYFINLVLVQYLA